MRKLTGALIGVIVTVVGASVAAHELINQDELRQRITEAVKKETGLSMTMESSSVQILPWPSFEAHNIVLQRAGQKVLLKAGTMHAGLSILSLLHREVRFQDFTVDKADLSLVRQADGEANWDVQPEQNRSASLKAPVPFAMHDHVGERVQAHWTLTLDGLHLTNSTVQWRDEEGGLNGGFQITTLDLAGLKSESPWINLQATHGGTPFTLQGHVGSLSALQSGKATWTFSLGTTLGADASHDWLNVDGEFKDALHLRGLWMTAQGEWKNLKDIEQIFPHAALPDVQGVGGEITLQGGSPLNSDGTWAQKGMALANNIVPERLHLHAAGITLKQGPVFKNVHIDANADAAPLSWLADVEWKNSAWHVVGNSAQLKDVDQAWLDRFKTPLPVETEIRSVSLSLASALTMPNGQPPENAQDDLRTTISGKISASHSDLTVQGKAHLLRIPNAILNDASFHAQVNGSGWSDIAINDLSFQSREAALNGKLHAVLDKNTPPLVNGDLHVTQLDLDALHDVWWDKVREARTTQGQQASNKPSVLVPGLPGQVKAPAVAPSAPHKEEAMPSSLPKWVERLRALDLDLHLALDRVIFYKRDYTDLATHVTLSGGHLRLEPITGQGQGISLSGQVDVDASSLPVQLSMTFQPLILPVGLVEQGLQLPFLLQGPMQFVGQVTGQGQTKEELLQSLKGHLGVSMVDGRVDGNVLGRLAGKAAFLENGFHSLRCLGVHMTLGDGAADLDTMSLQAGHFQTTGHGRVQLMTNEMLLHMLPSLDLGGAGASTPVLVTGLLNDPHIAQDRDAGGRFQVTFGGNAEVDPCNAALAAGREGHEGPVPTQQQEKSRVQPANILRALGVVH
ncbi:AsmA family protein [Swingsia samuiensis]|uniref:AsmA family protein n=1 Tax=Swingsia samuiensis TaxID=1293412 RepID=A0A4Y6UIC6_9PROT|nr:AsmA family protein [Swingsia samuiensis]QDH17272.1 AsmA family protein [Swingsia samuiensis]